MLGGPTGRKRGKTVEKDMTIRGNTAAWFAKARARINNSKAWQATIAFFRKWGVQWFSLAAALLITAVIGVGTLNRVD